MFFFFMDLDLDFSGSDPDFWLIWIRILIPEIKFDPYPEKTQIRNTAWN